MHTDWFEAKVAACVEAAWFHLMHGEWEVYLWFKRGELLVASNPPAAWGLELATPQRIPGHLEKPQVRMWIERIARQLPCLPSEVP